MTTTATKRCSRCGHVLAIEAFRVVQERARTVIRSMCHDCDLDYARQYAQDNREERREYHYRRKFGISIAEYDAMSAAQGGVCAVCGEQERRRARGSDGPRLLSVDHDHGTGQVRALLCHDCNVAIGLLDENPALIERAATYLRSFAGGGT